MKQSYILFFATTLSLAPVAVQAQQIPDSVNLVANGSFEELDGKLRRLGGIEAAKGWESPTEVDADLFSETVDRDNDAHAPKNPRGFQSALSGVNYAGVLWYSYMDKEPRSYIQTKLKRMLKKGKKYCITYYVSLSDQSKYAVDHLGAYASRIAVHKKKEASLTYEPQVPALMTTLYKDRQGWQGVCGTFTAKGDEHYLIIGNFAPTEKVNTEKLRRERGSRDPQKPIAYFYIDDVSVKEVKRLSECSCEQTDKDESEFIFGVKATANPGLKPAQRVDRSTIYFKRFKKDVDHSMKPMLDTLVSALNADPGIHVKLTGNVDAKEVERTRMRPDLSDLDKERAEAVKQYLVDAGIAADRITVAGDKGNDPAVEGDDEVSQSQNRRVEVDVVK